MLIDEEILTFAEAAKALPRVNGKRPHVSTLWRWARKGLMGVKLETRRIGARFVTSREALERFTKALAEIELPEKEKPKVLLPPRPRRGDALRQRAFAEAEAFLDREGI